jgi:O-antigen/teichoic acid export membrane protein
MTTCEIIESPPDQTALPTSGHQLAASVGRNTIFGIISGFTQVATRLATIPIVIAHLGLGGYGIWAIIMTTAAYMRFGAVGVKSAFQKYVAEATGSGDYNKANKLLSTGCAVMLVLSVAGLIPIFLFSGGIARLAGVPAPFMKQTSAAISVLALIMVMSNVGAVFEAILMGGHRIDIARRFTTGFTVAEAVAIVALLHFGHGLLAMASVMGVSELGFVACCYLASLKVVPQIRLKAKNVTSKVLGELFRFAGSYQLVSVLQISYVSILPIAILRVFGADYTGMYALSVRLISPAAMLQDAFLLSILSGGSMVYATGSNESMRDLLHKSFKVSLAFAVIPMALLAAFGTTIIFAWTGQNAPEFRTALVLVSIAAVFRGISILGLVLYRISGNALLDNLRQVFVIITLLCATVFTRQLGFYGLLGALAVAEFIGMLFMIYAVARTFHVFRPAVLFSDALRVAAATIGVVVVGFLVTQIPLPSAGPRMSATVRSGFIFIACGAALWPAFLVSKFMTVTEGQTLFRVLWARRSNPTNCAEVGSA